MAWSTFGLLACIPLFYDVLIIVSGRENKSAMMKDAHTKKLRKKKAIFLSVSPSSFVSCHQERAIIHFLEPLFPVKCSDTKTFSLHKITIEWNM
jgi:hypothetical protein